MKNGAKITNASLSIPKCGQSPLLSEKTTLLTVLWGNETGLREEKSWSSFTGLMGPQKNAGGPRNRMCDASNSQRLKTAPVRVRTLNFTGKKREAFLTSVITKRPGWLSNLLE